MSGNECQLKSEVLTKFGQIDLKYEILSQLSKDDNNVAIQIVTQQQLNRQCTYERIKCTLDFKTAIHLYDLNDMYIYVIDGYSPVYSNKFKSYELTGRAGSGFSIFELDISLTEGIVGNRVAGIFGGTSTSYGGDDKCNRKYVPAEIIMDTWGSCSTTEDSPVGLSVIAMGRTATNSGVGGMKIYNLVKLAEGETLTEIPLLLMIVKIQI